MKTSEIETLKTWITESDNIVFFGGAGVSTESGIPDFRSVDGLYHQKFDYPPETILSHSFFYSHTEEFYRFYREKMLPLEAKPNAAHLALAKLEQEGKLKAIVTQNIDGLHQKVEAAASTSSTARSGATAASAAASSIPRSLSATSGVFRTAIAAGSSSPRSCSMKRVWTKRASTAPSVPSPGPIF